MNDPALTAWQACRTAIDTAAGSRKVTLVAVSKTQPAERIRQLAQTGQTDFGENYWQEASSKIAACADLALRWHFIGPLQSNKARLVAQHCDWVHSVDRPKLVALLSDGRSRSGAALNVLIQVNVDAEANKSGCKPEHLQDLANTIAGADRLRLRGLMAIPAPLAEPEARRPAFARMRELFDRLRLTHPDMDTLSMGMSDDFRIAIEEGATMVRIGSALFGARASKNE